MSGVTRLALWSTASLTLHLAAVVAADAAWSGAPSPPREAAGLRLVTTASVTPPESSPAASRHRAEREPAGAPASRCDAPAPSSPPVAARTPGPPPAVERTPPPPAAERVTSRPSAAARPSVEPPPSTARPSRQQPERSERSDTEAAPAPPTQEPSELRGDSLAAAASTSATADAAEAAGAGATAAAAARRAASQGDGPGGGGRAQGAAAAAGADAARACWSAVGAELQRRVREAPTALRRRGLTGELRVRFALDEHGTPTDIAIESLSGSRLLVQAVEMILEEPFAQSCPGEGRWPVEFAPAR